MNKDWEKGYSAGAVDTIGHVVSILHRTMEEISNLENDLGELDVDYEELDHYWTEGYNAGYRRAIEWVKEHPEKDMSKLVEKMMSDWHDS